MKIKGAIEVEGVTLHLDISILGGEKEIYVTNISPHCLVIPKERWSLRCLGLTAKTLEELSSKGLAMLAQVVDPEWKVIEHLFSLQTFAELDEAVKLFLDKALIFPEAYEIKKQSRVLEFPLRDRIISAGRAADGMEAIPQSLKAELPLTALDLPQRVLKILKKRYQLETIGELRKLGKIQMVMTPGLTKKDVETISQRLKDLGLWYEEEPKLAEGDSQ